MDPDAGTAPAPDTGIAIMHHDSGPPIPRDAAPPPNCSTTAGPSGTPPELVPGQWTDISPPGLHRPYGSTPPYGCMDIHVHPCDPYTLYLTSDIEGLWRSTDGGASWSLLGDMPTPVSGGGLAIDPLDPLHMYFAGGVRGATLGFWISHDGGETWHEPAGFTAHADNSVGGWTNDTYGLATDPVDFNHVLVTFHSPFEFSTDAGFLESMDGGESWIRHFPRGWGAGHSIFFLSDSHTWLIGTQGHGFWRTADSGDTWTQVSDRDMQHGGVDMFYAPDGVLYVGGLSEIMRSTDDGMTFDFVGEHTANGYYSIVSDGHFLYAAAANTGAAAGDPVSYIVSPQDDGTTWSRYNDQTFSTGPYRMAFDPVNRILYSANWNEGVLALRVIDP